MDEYPRKVYQQLHSRKFIKAYDKLCRQFPFESIEMERTPNLGKAPVDKFIFFRNGTATYEGIRNVELIGLYNGLSSVGEFGRLSYLIEDLDIENMKDEYRYAATDCTSIYLRINRVDGTQKQIQDYGHHGPIKLWGIQQVMGNLICTIQWEAVSDKPAG